MVAYFKRRSVQVTLVFLVLIAVFSYTVLVTEKNYVLLSFLILTLVLLLFISRFESRQVSSKEMVFLAVLIAVVSASRLPFVLIPNVQPVTFFVIICGIAFGAESGFLVGASVALISNLVLGQGTWTPWQMLAWGLIGFAAGLLRNTPLLQKRSLLIGFGFVVAFLYGWLLNLHYTLIYVRPLTGQAIWTANLASATFDLMHALGNAFFLAVFATAFLKLIRRFQLKYGLVLPDDEGKSGP